MSKEIGSGPCDGLKDHPNKKEGQEDPPPKEQWPLMIKRFREWSLWWIHWNLTLSNELTNALQQLDTRDADFETKYKLVTEALASMGIAMRDGACPAAKKLNEVVSALREGESGGVVITDSTQPPPPPFKGGSRD